MSLTSKEVAHIAQLARLGLTSAETEKFTQQLSSILDYVEQLKKINTDGVEPTAQVTGLENIYRTDTVDEVSAGVKEQLIKAAPDSENNLVKTKAVFD